MSRKITECIAQRTSEERWLLLRPRCTCGSRFTGGTLVNLNRFKRGIQFQNELVKIVQGDIEIMVSLVTTGVWTDGLMRLLQVNSLSHPQNVIGHHVRHAVCCRHHVMQADGLLQWKEREYGGITYSALVRFLSPVFSHALTHAA